MSIEGLQARLAQFADDRDWAQFHSPKNLVMALTSEVGELSELFQWLSADDSMTFMSDERAASRVREELADVFGYVLRLASVLEVDLDTCLHAKIDSNAERYPVARARGRSEKYTDL